MNTLYIMYEQQLLHSLHNSTESDYRPALCTRTRTHTRSRNRKKQSEGLRPSPPGFLCHLFNPLAVTLLWFSRVQLVASCATIKAAGSKMWPRKKEKNSCKSCKEHFLFQESRCSDAVFFSQTDFLATLGNKQRLAFSNCAICSMTRPNRRRRGFRDANAGAHALDQ